MPLDYSTTMALEDLDAKYFKDNYLTGFTFFGSDGQPLPNSFYEEHLLNAMGRLEQTTQIDVIRRARKAEQHDFKFNDYLSFSFLQVNHFPMVSVEEVRFTLPAQSGTQIFPKEWIRFTDRGQINLVPVAGSSTDFVFAAGGTWLPFVLNGLYSHVPLAWEIDYTTGFDPCKVPRIITQAVAKLAAIEVYLDLDNLIRPLGVSSESLSVDGLSQSRGFLTPAFKAKIDEYKEDLWGPLGIGKGAGLIEQIMDTYGVIPMSVA